MDSLENSHLKLWPPALSHWNGRRALLTDTESPHSRCQAHGLLHGRLSLLPTVCSFVLPKPRVGDLRANPGQPPAFGISHPTGPFHCGRKWGARRHVAPCSMRVDLQAMGGGCFPSGWVLRMLSPVGQPARKRTVPQAWGATVCSR